MELLTMTTVANTAEKYILDRISVIVSDIHIAQLITAQVRTS